jgi:hypothetical protein
VNKNFLGLLHIKIKSRIAFSVAQLFPSCLYLRKTITMQKKYDYRLLETTDRESFYLEVEQLLADGWELHGQLIAFPDNVEEGKVEAVRYIQAFVKASGERRSTGFSVSR